MFCGHFRYCDIFRGGVRCKRIKLFIANVICLSFLLEQGRPRGLWRDTSVPRGGRCTSQEVKAVGAAKHEQVRLSLSSSSHFCFVLAFSGSEN